MTPTEVELPRDAPFWQQMQAIQDAQNATGHVPRSAEEIDAELWEMREGWAKRQEAIERLQEETRLARRTEQGSSS